MLYGEKLMQTVGNFIQNIHFFLLTIEMNIMDSRKVYAMCIILPAYNRNKYNKQ
jgi:hypothetical protein